MDYVKLFLVYTTEMYILRKARAFYNELSCDIYDIPTVIGDQAMGVDPYFSIPVIHPPNIALIV
ncbi:hypothetical protein Ddye_000528 [Dipteronia dyeriana]|uniref:Uncharacterized protein n=1 Tax=Dipteronia dyeriana TaxID=168575 RepID=A0AAD9XLV9_9ROSI|nr:hypothetical protein Ddye_000528 [Dipteronia dyeriana]